MPMSKYKRYRGVKFTPEIITAAFVEFKNNGAKNLHQSRLEVDVDDETWNFDDEAEFFAYYRKANVDEGNFGWIDLDQRFDFSVRFSYRTSSIQVKLADRAAIERVFGVFEANAASCRLPIETDEELKKTLKIFIGHGRDGAWRDVKDHLHEKHGFDVVAYETEPRAGLTIADILEDMQDESSFAILVLTAENEAADGTMHARENVIHEVGLFQGRLGMRRALVLLEDGCAQFSNIAGIQYLTFSRGRIKETFGDILATIKREFSETE